MADQVYNIAFDGYWREKNKGGIPAKSGIYCVYSCVYNDKEKNVTLKKLIYIGESENVNTRIANHEKFPDWNKHVKQGETLCFSFGEVSSASRERCEAAMIFKHKPPVNSDCVDSFNYDKTTINLSGKINYLTAQFVANRTK